MKTRVGKLAQAHCLREWNALPGGWLVQLPQHGVKLVPAGTRAYGSTSASHPKPARPFSPGSEVRDF